MWLWNCLVRTINIILQFDTEIYIISQYALVGVQYIDPRATYAPPTLGIFDLSNYAPAFSPQASAVLVPQAQLSLGSIFNLHVQIVRRHQTKLDVVMCVRGKARHNRLHRKWDIWQFFNVGYSSLGRPVAGESQNEFSRKETEIFSEIFTSEGDIFTFWSSVSTILDSSLWDLVTITKGAGLMRIYVFTSHYCSFP